MIQRAARPAARNARIVKPDKPHTLRRTLATLFVYRGHDIRTIQEVLGHADVSTTLIHSQVLNTGRRGVRGPLDET